MKRFDQKYIIKTFKQRIRTQDRKDILPMKLISSYLGKLKDWEEVLTEYVLKIKFHIDSQDNVVSLKDVDSITIEDTGDVSIKYESKIDNKIKSVPLYTKKFRTLENNNSSIFSPMHVNDNKDIRELSLDHDIPISVLMRCYKFEFISLFNEYASTSDGTISKNSVSKKDLLSDMEKLFNVSDVFVVHINDNLQKSNSFILCDEFLTCKHSRIKQKINELNNLNNSK